MKSGVQEWGERDHTRRVSVCTLGNGEGDCGRRGYCTMYLYNVKFTLG